MSAKVIVLYRVIQDWRAPVFEKLSKEENLDLEVWYGPDFKGTKIISTRKHYSFKKRMLFSFKMSLKSTNGIIAMPFSPFLFFSLIYKNPDVIVCEGASNLINSVIAFFYCKIFSKKYIWWSLGKLQNRKYDVKRSLFGSFINFLEKNASAIITYSSIGEEYFLDLGIPKERIYKAVNVVDTEQIFNNIAERDDLYELRPYYIRKYKFITLFVGALTSTKSIDILIHAQKILEGRNPLLGLIIVGDGHYRFQLEQLVAKLNLKNVEFVGRKIDDNYKYFSIADVFVLPGLGGLAISEAMCYGLPIIVSIGDGCEVDLVTANNGIINKDITAESLANDIFFFYTNNQTRDKYGMESRRIIKEQYNINTYLSKVTNAILN